MSWPFAASPFHEGERAIQERLGVRERVESGGRRLIYDFLPDQHREFYAGLSSLVLGIVDTEGQPWCLMITGRPGFVSSPDPRILRIDTPSLMGDPVERVVRRHADIGILGIDLATRRRNRANGTIATIAEDGFEVAVAQSYGNCPKYIQCRNRLDDGVEALGRMVDEGDALDAAAQALIAAADTFFIASAFGRSSDEASHGVDASHRGGPPGFIRIDDERTLTVPDFVGNFAFNTLGNLLLNPRCGLLFLDFDTGTTLQIAAEATILWEEAALAAFPGAQRLLRFRVLRLRRMEPGVVLRWISVAG